MFKKILISLLFFVFLVVPININAQEDVDRDSLRSTLEENIEAKVVDIIEQEERETFGTKHTFQRLKIKIIKGEDVGLQIEVEHGINPALYLPKYKVGDEVLLTKVRSPDGTFDYYIVDYIRRKPLYILAFLFILTALAVAQKKGLSSLIGLGFSFLVIFKFILPNLLDGKNPILITITGGILAILATFYITHGFRRKTHVAILGTIIALIITSFLAFYFVDLVHLTGYSSEEARFLQAQVQNPIDIKGLLLAGIIVGLIGILDDITITQVAIVEKLKESSTKLSSIELFKKSMSIGQDHIGAVVNTLVLVYTGAALPFLLLFTSSNLSFTSAVNFEIVAEEIVRTLVASIGLMLAVPITTFLAVLIYKKR